MPNTPRPANQPDLSPYSSARLRVGLAGRPVGISRARLSLALLPALGALLGFFVIPAAASVAGPHLSVTTTVGGQRTATAPAGATLRYLVTAKNDGTVALGSVNFSAVLSGGNAGLLTDVTPDDVIVCDNKGACIDAPPCPPGATCAPPFAWNAATRTISYHTAISAGAATAIVFTAKAPNSKVCITTEASVTGTPAGAAGAGSATGHSSAAVCLTTPTPAPSHAHLSVTKVVNRGAAVHELKPGDRLHYEVKATNDGQVALHDVTIKDALTGRNLDLLTGFTAVDVIGCDSKGACIDAPPCPPATTCAPPFSWNAATRTVSYRTNLGPGMSATILFDLTAPAAPAEHGVGACFVNVATGSATPPSGATVSAASNSTSSCLSPPIHGPHLSATKTAIAVGSPVGPGVTLHYQVSARNNGGSTLHVIVRDTLTGHNLERLADVRGFDWVHCGPSMCSATPYCSGCAPALTWNAATRTISGAGDLSPGEDLTMSFFATIPANTPGGSCFVNRGEARGLITDIVVSAQSNQTTSCTPGTATSPPAVGANPAPPATPGQPAAPPGTAVIPAVPAGTPALTPSTVGTSTSTTTGGSPAPPPGDSSLPQQPVASPGTPASATAPALRTPASAPALAAGTRASTSIPQNTPAPATTEQVLGISAGGASLAQVQAIVSTPNTGAGGGGLLRLPVIGLCLLMCGLILVTGMRRNPHAR